MLAACLTLLLAKPYRASLPLSVDGRLYVVRVDGGRGEPLELLLGGKVLSGQLKRAWKPWALQVADVDDDGRPDVCVGIVKATHQLKQPHTCLWIFGVRDGELTRKWLGSTMGRPLLRFWFVKTAEGTVLHTIERTLDGRPAEAAYRWKGFGFKQISSKPR